MRMDATRGKALLLPRARRLRASQTDAETLLWRRLRAHRFGESKFRRQHRVGGYIVDFFCAEARLVIELDGGGHAAAPRLTCDGRRTERLQRLGLRVLRFRNRDVMSNLDGVLEKIAEAVSSR